MGQVLRGNIISEQRLCVTGVLVYGRRVFGRRGKSVPVFNQVHF
jgi:hypothetical protein